MAVTIFTNGTARYRTDEDGVEILSIAFDDELRAIYNRYDLRPGARIETDGAVAETYGKGGTVFEIISLASLRIRIADETMALEASGSCRRVTDDGGLWVCEQGSCSGSCREKTFLFFSYCSCG